MFWGRGPKTGGGAPFDSLERGGGCAPDEQDESLACEAGREASADGGSRTPMTLRSRGPEPRASASSATSAFSRGSVSSARHRQSASEDSFDPWFSGRGGSGVAS